MRAKILKLAVVCCLILASMFVVKRLVTRAEDPDPNNPWVIPLPGNNLTLPNESNPIIPLPGNQLQLPNESNPIISLPSPQPPTDPAPIVNEIAPANVTEPILALPDPTPKNTTTPLKLVDLSGFASLYYPVVGYPAVEHATVEIVNPYDTILYNVTVTVNVAYTYAGVVRTDVLSFGNLAVSETARLNDGWYTNGEPGNVQLVSASGYV